MFDAQKANETLLELTTKYQNIKYGDLTIPVPYFINTAERIYKEAMKSVGIEKELVDKALKLVKDGLTALGRGGGKGTPDEIAEDLVRLITYLGAQGYSPKSVEIIRYWMANMHIGLDCSGYVYNVFSTIEQNQGIKIIENLAWADMNSIKPSHAGVFIFDSDKLQTITDYSDLRPLDILVRKNYSHTGVLADYEGSLCVADCSMGRNGITFSKVELADGKVLVEGYDSWTRHIAQGNVVVKRINF